MRFEVKIKADERSRLPVNTETIQEWRRDVKVQPVSGQDLSFVGDQIVVQRFVDPPNEKWFGEGRNHRQIGPDSWERELVHEHYFIQISDLEQLILLLIDLEAQLDLTETVPIIDLHPPEPEEDESWD